MSRSKELSERTQHFFKLQKLYFFISWKNKRERMDFLYFFVEVKVVGQAISLSGITNQSFLPDFFLIF